MRMHRVFLAASFLFSGALLMGCQTTSTTTTSGPLPEETNTQTLVQYPQRVPLDAPTITLRMLIFDDGLGDTTTGVGAGGAQPLYGR